MGQTAADKDSFPMCRKHHEEFHGGIGFCKGWDKDQRRSFQEQEIERFNTMYAEQQELGVLQEPARRAV